jgi:F-type H+-transporting ATPase subunit epsilon
MASADIHRELHCVVVTPERALLDEPADFVAVPLYDGELGVLPGRAPLIGRLGCGELRLRRGERTERLFVDGGFVQVRANSVTVLTSRAQRAEEIDAAAAEAVLRDGGAPGDRTPAGPEARARARERARVQLRIARHQEQGGRHE